MPGGAGTPGGYQRDQSAGQSTGAHSRSKNQGGVRSHSPHSSGPRQRIQTDTHKDFQANPTKYVTPPSRSILDYSPTIQIAKAGIKAITNLFTPKTEQQKVEANIKKGYDVNNPAEMHAYGTKKYDFGQGGDGDGGPKVTTITKSLVTAPTADQAAGFGHQWNFQAYGNQTQATGNPYDYTKAPYAKKGKLIRKYATGQEIKNFSKGKRFGPPPLKGPDSQGLQVILENSDYFKKLIG